MNHAVKIEKFIRKAKIQGAKEAMKIGAEEARRVVLVVIRRNGWLSKIAIFIYFQKKRGKCSIPNIIAVRKLFHKVGVQALEILAALFRAETTNLDHHL